MPTIGLCMIVRNEAKLIRRCLDSCRPLVDFVCISDTGSTDETKPIIRAWLAEHQMPGLVIDRPWHDFASNRNYALESIRVRTDVDYVFMIDADDKLEIATLFDTRAFKIGMDKDVYDIMVSHGGVIHARPQIFRNNYPKTCWIGVLHEYLDVGQPFTRETVNGLTVLASIEGSRNADPLKFQKDAEILENALKTEKNEYLQKRYTFYLAQSYRDAHQHEKSRIQYQRRAEMGGWDQEVYVSLVEVIRACIELGGEFELSVARQSYDRAIKVLPQRMEADYYMAFLYRKLGKNKEGTEVARRGIDLKMPMPSGLFINPWIYNYGLKDEFAVNAYWSGLYLDCLAICLDLLGGGQLPHEQIRRVAANAQAALAKFVQPPAFNTTFFFSN